MPEEAREMVFELDGRRVPFRLIRRRGRRKITLQLEPREGLRVLAPLRFPLRELEGLLKDERAWLRRKLAALERWEELHPPRRFLHGEALPLLGEDWRLCVISEPGRRRPGVKREARENAPGRIVLFQPAGLPEDERRDLARKTLANWYRRLARRIIGARVEHWCPRIGAQVGTLSMRDNRSCWASYSSTGRLSFNWKIVMAPPAVLDYLVVHELCHFFHPDHSPEFWAKVGSYLPDYAEQRAWLRKRGETLYL